MMFRGRGRLGDAAPAATPPSFAQNFLTSAEVWQSPSAGITAAEGIFSNPSTAFSGTSLATTLGTLAVPLLLIWFVMGKK